MGSFWEVSHRCNQQGNRRAANCKQVWFAAFTHQVKLRAAQIAEHRTWLKQSYIAINESVPWQQSGLRLVLNHIRADATQSDIISKGKLKLFVSELCHIFVNRSIFDHTSWLDLQGAMDKRKILGDISQVRGTGTGRGALGLLGLPFFIQRVWGTICLCLANWICFIAPPAKL